MKNLKIFTFLLAALTMAFGTNTASAHCDSYDGPVVKAAMKALQTNNVTLVFKWIKQDQEKEITDLFNKTYSLKNQKNGDKEVYEIVQKHFLETLVRLHREMEGEPFTGLKPAGTTKQIIKLTDQAIADRDIEGFLVKLNNHVGKVIKEKYEKLISLDKVKDESVEKGREYVKAYVDYTHTIEMMHDIIEHGVQHGH